MNDFPEVQGDRIAKTYVSTYKVWGRVQTHGRKEKSTDEGIIVLLKCQGNVRMPKYFHDNGSLKATASSQS